MFHHISRTSAIKMKRNFVTYSDAKNVLKSGLKIIADNLVFVRIQGNTADEIVKGVDLTNKTCLITGANSGIGLEMTKCLRSQGCAILMACRNSYAASGVIRHIEDGRNIRFYETNLASLKSVKNSFEKMLKNEKKIDIVLLNAAVFGLPWTLTEDGLETTFQVNYLSQYYLLMNIEKILAPDVRVVFVSSDSHKYVEWPSNYMPPPTEEMLSLPKEQYTSIKAYNISKLCSIISMHYLGYRWMNTGKQVFSANPGSFVKTGLCRNWWVYEVLYSCMKPFAKSIAQAASTPIYCATSPALAGLSALYYKNCTRTEESDVAKDLSLSFKLQDLALDMIRERVAAVDEREVASDVKADKYEEGSKDTMDETLISNYSN